MSTQDIRDWARANGYKVGRQGRIAQSVRDDYAAANGNADDAGEEEELEIGLDDLDLDDDPGPGPESAPEPPEEPALSGVVREQPPVPQPRPRRRLRGVSRKPRQPKTRAVKTARKRVSLESITGSAWTAAAMGLASFGQGRMIPVARCLEMQSPVAGIVCEDMLKNTPADKILQPFARMAETGGQAGALLGLPALVGLVTAQPALYPVALPVMRVLVLRWLELAGPAMKKAQDRAARIREDWGDVNPDEIIATWWAGVPVAAQASPDEEAAVRRARGE